MRSAYRPAQSIHTPSSSPAGSRPKRPNHASSGAAYNSSTRIYRNWDSEGLTIAWRRSPGNGGRVKRSGSIQRANEHRKVRHRQINCFPKVRRFVLAYESTATFGAPSNDRLDKKIQTITDLLCQHPNLQKNAKIAALSD